MTANLDVLATAHCGCRVQRPIGTAIVELAMCPLHEAAPQLLGALRMLAQALEVAATMPRGMIPAACAFAAAQARAAIKAAEEA